MNTLSITLKKANGDLFLDVETGRPSVVSNASKTDQDLADLYLSSYDEDRNWGASLHLIDLPIASLMQAKAILFLRLQQANDRILAKQALDPTITPNEQIMNFSRANVLVDVQNQALIFFSVAELGDGSEIKKMIGQDFKQTSLKHILPPPVGITAKD